MLVTITDWRASSQGLLRCGISIRPQSTQGPRTGREQVQRGSGLATVAKRDMT